MRAAAAFILAIALPIVACHRGAIPSRSRLDVEEVLRAIAGCPVPLTDEAIRREVLLVARMPQARNKERTPP